MKKAKILHQLISKTLLDNINKKQAEKDKTYHKYPSYKSLGISAPKLSKILKRFNKNIVQLNCKESLRLAELLAERKVEEFVLSGNYVLKNHIDYLITSIDFIDHYADCFTSWSTVDDFCINVLQAVLQKEQKSNTESG